MCGFFSLFSWSDTQVEATLSAFASALQCLQHDSGGVGDKRVARDCLFRVYVCVPMHVCICVCRCTYVCVEALRALSVLKTGSLPWNSPNRLD